MSIPVRRSMAASGTPRFACGALIAGGLLCLASARDVHAANANFQNFFFAICATATNELAQRCGESNGGNLSGASESSLNPNQTLSGNDPGLNSAQGRSMQTREDADAMRAATSEPASDAQVAIGPWSLLVNVRGTWLDVDRDTTDQERGYDSDLGVGELGFDYRLSDRSVIGGLLSIERTDADFDAESTTSDFAPPDSAGSFEVDSTAFTVFASFAPTDQAFVDASAGYVSSDHDFTRRAIFQPSGGDIDDQQNVLTSGSTDGDQTWISVNGGFQWANGAWTYGPHVSTTYARSTVDAYDEVDLSGNGLSMRVGEAEDKSLTAIVGFSAGVAISTAGAVLVPQFRVDFEHEFDDDGDSLTTSFEQDPADTPLALSGDDRDSDSFNIGFGLATILPNGWSPFFDAEVLVGYENRDRWRAVLGLRKEL